MPRRLGHLVGELERGTLKIGVVPTGLNELEHNLQSKITKGLNAPSPDTAALLPDAQAMLVKFDEEP